MKKSEWHAEITRLEAGINRELRLLGIAVRNQHETKSDSAAFQLYQLIADLASLTDKEVE